jgi:hypothetical protein
VAWRGQHKHNLMFESEDVNPDLAESAYMN